MEKGVAILKKLNLAKASARVIGIKKSGKNAFSNYEYYTPDQIDEIVFKVSQEHNIFNKYDLLKDEDGGLTARLVITDLDSGEEKEYTFPTATPEIKATNAAQQIGGAITYSKRYLLQNAYDIADSNLDPDTTENTKKNQKEAKKQAPKDERKPFKKFNANSKEVSPRYTEVLANAREKGATIEGFDKLYVMDRLTREAVINDLK